MPKFVSKFHFATRSLWEWMYFLQIYNVSNVLSVISYVLAWENRQEQLSELQKAGVQLLTIFFKGM